MFWPQRRLLADDLALVPGLNSRLRGDRLCLNVHGHPRELMRPDQDAGLAGANERRPLSYASVLWSQRESRLLRTLSVESPGGISPPGAPRTVHDPLESHGSRCSAVA